MAQLLSNAHIECIINGHRFTGLADEDRPYEFPGGDDLFNESMGQDGGLYGSSTPRLGGDMTFRLAPTSPTAQWAIGENEARKSAIINGEPFRYYSGTLADPVQGRSARMDGGILKRVPTMVEPGQTFEIVIAFERITSNVDGAQFNAPLVTAA